MRYLVAEIVVHRLQVHDVYASKAGLWTPGKSLGSFLYRKDGQATAEVDELLRGPWEECSTDLPLLSASAARPSTGGSAAIILEI